MTSCIKIVFIWNFLLTISYALNTVLNVDELNSIHYAVDILNKPVLKEKAWEGEAMTVYNNHGQEYVCTLPNVVGLYSDSKKDDNIFDQLVDISVLLKPMETAPCLIKTVDWWTYEFCYSSVIKQYHLEDNKASGPILILGKYESEYNWKNSSETKNRLQRFHSQFYVNGTKCDLTQEPRRTEVRFQCEDGVGDYIQRVDEPESCRYIVTVATTRVCHHPYLRMQGTNSPNSITCSPALTQEQYDKYLRFQELKRKEEESSRARWLKNAEILSDIEGLDGKSITDIKQDNSGNDYDDLKMNIKIFRLNPLKNILSLPAQERREEVAIETQITLQEMNQGASPVVAIAKILDSTGPPYNDNSGPDKVIDGDLRSYWNVDIPNGRYHNNWFITFELKRRYTVVSTKLRSYGDTTHDVTKFKLESSDDLVNWHMGGSTSDVTAGSSKWQNFNGFKATGKYLRFTVTETQSGWQPWLSEISFTGYTSDLNIETSEDAQNNEIHHVDEENGKPENLIGNNAQMRQENKDRDSWNILEEDDEVDDDDDDNMDVDDYDNNDTDDSETDKEVHLENAAIHKLPSEPYMNSQDELDNEESLQDDLENEESFQDLGDDTFSTTEQESENENNDIESNEDINEFTQTRYTKSSNKEKFFRLQKRLKQLGKVFMSQKHDKSQEILQDGSQEQILSQAALDEESLAELQKMVENINKGRIKQLEDEVEEWTTKLLDKNIFLDLDETEIEQEEQRMGSALSSIMDALGKAEDKLSKARADMETLEEFLDGQLQEMESEDSIEHPPSQEPKDTLDTPTPPHPQDQGPTEGDPNQDYTTGTTTDTHKKITEIVYESRQLPLQEKNYERYSQSINTYSTFDEHLHLIIDETRYSYSSSFRGTCSIKEYISWLFFRKTNEMCPSNEALLVITTSHPGINSKSVFSSPTVSFSSSAINSAQDNDQSDVELLLEKVVKRGHIPRKIPRSKLSSIVDKDGSKKEKKKISDKNSKNVLSGNTLKSGTEEESHKNQLEEKIKDKLQKLGLEKIENTNEKSPHLRQKLLELKSKVKEIGIQKKDNDIEKSIREKLVNPIQEKLEKRGILSEGRKFEVKILTPNSLEDEDKNSLSSMSQEETEAFQNMIVNLLSANAEEIEERENHKKLEANYAFNWDDDVKLPEEEESKSQ